MKDIFNRVHSEIVSIKLLKIYKDNLDKAQYLYDEFNSDNSDISSCDSDSYSDYSSDFLSDSVDEDSYSDEEIESTNNMRKKTKQKKINMQYIKCIKNMSDIVNNKIPLLAERYPYSDITTKNFHQLVCGNKKLINTINKNPEKSPKELLKLYKM